LFVSGTRARELSGRPTTKVRRPAATGGRLLGQELTGRWWPLRTHLRQTFRAPWRRLLSVSDLPELLRSILPDPNHASFRHRVRPYGPTSFQRAGDYRSSSTTRRRTQTRSRRKRRLSVIRSSSD